jgi:patatin-like phospholipase/acyl hydrolase
MSVADKLKKTGPRKLLTIDGGGIRGMLSVEILARIEQILRDAHDNQKLKLCDYFDYIAGTSTGAIIAAALAWGMTIDEVRSFYVNNGADMFEQASMWSRLRSLGASKFQAENLSRQLQDVFGADTKLGSDRLQTLLMVVLRNATTDSPWPLSNNPNAMFNKRDLEDCNLDLPLWQLVRASTAAPTYFPPETVQVGPRQFIFVDGGMTMYNNPAFQLFKMATLEPYQLGWETGEENMLLVSIGTGFAADANKDLRPEEMNLMYSASSIPAGLMTAALQEQDLLCRMFGNCRYGDPISIDYEIGGLMPARVSGLEKKLFTYVRYNAELTTDGLQDLGISDIDPKHVQQMDSVEHIAELKRVGTAVGQQRVKPEHFAGFVPN